MKTVALGEAATIERVAIDPTQLDPETRYLGLEHIERGGAIVGYDTVGGAELASTKFRFTANQVLFGKLRPYLAKIALPEFSGVCSTDILPISPGGELDRRYLAHYLRAPSVVDFASSRATGANLPRLSPSVLASLEVPLPPLAEQRRIGAILDQADALRVRRRESLAEADDLTPAVFHDMFGREPAVKSVDQIADLIRTGPFGSQLLHSEFTESGIAVLGLDNVVSNDFRWVERRYISHEKYQNLKRYTVRPGDVLISIMGTTGRCVVVPPDIPTAINTKHLCAITTDSTRITPEFLRAAFLWHAESRAHLARQTKGSIMDGLNMGIIKAMPVPVPSIDLQREFADRVAAINVQRAAAERSLASLDELFASLQARAFSAQL